MKNLLFLTHVGNPGGAEFKMLKLCEANQKCSKVLFMQNGSLADKCDEIGVLSELVEMPNAIISFSKKDFLKSAFKLIPSVLGFSYQIKNHFKNFDVLVCMSQKSFIFASIGNLFTRKKLIWYMNDLISDEQFNKKLIKISIMLSKLCADHVILNSQASLDAWIRSGGDKRRTSVSYSGIDIEDIDVYLHKKKEIRNTKSKLSKDGKPLIGIFGRICDWKGQDIFLKAIAKIPDVNAIIVGGVQFGEDKYEQYLHDLAEELGISDKVQFLGHSDNVPILMAACDVITHCSTTPEPFGRIIVEAMLCTKPVIATNAGGAKEIIEQNKSGILVPMKDIDALSNEIIKCVRDQNFASKIASSARTRAERFSSKRMCDEFMHIVSQLK